MRSAMPGWWLLLNPFQKKRDGVRADGPDGVVCLVKVRFATLAFGPFPVHPEPCGEGAAVVVGFVVVAQEQGECDRQPTASRDDEERSPSSHGDTLQRKEVLSEQS